MNTVSFYYFQEKAESELKMNMEDVEARLRFVGLLFFSQKSFN